ncbi:DUF6544 family protein [Paenibacillus stellifer]|uniref:DUF6544 family protein n=1 Tax=Paenibacillus stellifer TaxID=169760 RepID=UPI000B2BB7A9|nr:DUF6544 family protein [Paenibacillus stellifer]
MPEWLWIALAVLDILIVTVVLAAAISKTVFDRNANKLAGELLHGSPAASPGIASPGIASPGIVMAEDLDGLPLPVRKWLEGAHIIGTEKITSVRLKQTGQMRTKEGGPWMKVRAEQYFRADEPGFVWKADVQMAPLLHLSGLDSYQAGHGRMSIKLLSLLPVVDAKGPELDYSTMVRYLAEMPWFPAAAISPYIRWEPINDRSALAAISYKGISASGVFAFNDQGDLISIPVRDYRY